MKTCIVIPARYQSSRLPGKLLLTINHKTILQHTHDQSMKSKADAVYIFTDSELIAESARSYCDHDRVRLTAPDCVNGTERISRHLDLIPEEYQTIVNVQGDEPFVDPRNIDYAIDQHRIYGANCYNITLHQRITDLNRLKSTSSVKVQFNKLNEVMTYTRGIIPHNKSGIFSVDQREYNEFTGIYVYDRTKLSLYHKMEKSRLQEDEDIEQLRVLENGHRMMTFSCPYPNEISINTLEDYDFVRGSHER